MGSAVVLRENWYMSSEEAACCTAAGIAAECRLGLADDGGNGRDWEQLPMSSAVRLSPRK